MKHISTLAFLFSFLSLAVIGCSSGGDPIVTPTATDSVAYKTNTNYKYVEHPRDSTDHNMNVTDTITASVKAAGQSLDDQSGDVTVIENMHTLATTAAVDTTYIAQKSGDFYHYNFGLEGFSGFLKGSLGWVLQAKLNAAPGTTWVAKAKTSVPLAIAPISADVSINATQMADTTIVVGSESVSVKHVMHTITISAIAHTITSYIDTYVSAKYGIVATVRHSGAIDVQPYYSGQVPGSEKVMVSHP
jgi:hypothetical protein